MPLYWGKKNISGVNASLLNNQESSGGVDTSDATATSNDIRKPKTAYVSTGKVIGTMPEYDAMTIEPSEEQQVINSGKFLSGDITVNGVSPFYVGSSVTRQGATEIIPTKESQVAVQSGTYTNGDIVVNPIPEQYIITDDADALAEHIRLNKKAYVNRKQVIGTMPEQSAQTITPSETKQTVSGNKYLTGDITVNAISSTYVGSQVTRQSAKTITPTKSSQTAVSANVYTTGALTVAPIPSQYITTTDANATASDILNGKTAYVNGVKITGNVVVQKYYSGSSAPSSSLGNNGDLYLKV